MDKYTLERKGILSYATAWMGFENIRLNEIIQSQKSKYSMIPFI
jgi:hypothetical protein